MDRCLLLAFAFLLHLYTSSAWAVNCQRAATLVENTICSDAKLRWLDKTLSVIYRANLEKEDAQQMRKIYQEWNASLQSCTSGECIRHAYYQGINRVSNVDDSFSWDGQWWHTRAPNMSGGILQFSRNSEWSVTVNLRLWAGVNQDEFSAEARKVNGMVLIENIRGVRNCMLLIIPRKDGRLQVHSNVDPGCRLVMTEGISIDGAYQRAENDPRPAPSLLSLGVLPDEALDRAFRALVGGDYQAFVDTANAFIYESDQDKLNATVVSMWLRGAANRNTAMIMYTAKGDIWAARLFPEGDKLKMHYFTTRGSVEKMPRTLEAWKARYMDK